MRIEMSYDKRFMNLYNHFTYTDKGKKYLEMMGISRDKLDPASMGKLYFSEDDGDRTIDVNANVGSKSKSPNHFIAEIYKGLNKVNSLALIHKQMTKLYDDETADECLTELITGGLYFHDLSGNAGVSIPYCWAWSAANIMVGRQYGQLQSKPPKRSDSFIAVLIESIFDLAHEQAGALAIPDLFVCLKYYYKKDGIDPIKDKDKITNDYQRITHSLNQTYRIGGQSAFTNVSIMDRPILETTFKDWTNPDGSKVDIEYVIQIQNIFLEFMAAKDPTSKLPYRFPVTTLNIHTTATGEIIDKQFLHDACVYNKEGIFNIYITRGAAKLASCCRMINNLEMMKEYSRFDSFGNAGLSLGSARVVTLNLARIGREAERYETKYFTLLEKKLEETRKLLLCQRKILETRISQGFLKFFDMDWLILERMFSTVGIIALWESLKEMGYDITTPEGIEFAKKVFTFIEKKLEGYSKEDGVAFNLEQIPGEGAASTLAKQDKTYFGNEDYPYQLYSNQFVPLFEDVNLIDRAKIDGQLCANMTGGSICHLNIGCSATPQQMKDLIEFAVKCGLEHFALNPSFNMCENEHVSIGKSTDKVCPVCGGEIVNNYTRVVGYFTDVKNWNKARRDCDFPNRKFNFLDEVKKEKAA